MKKLIDNQTIDFDNHSAGDGKEITVKGLHMHKRMNGKKFKGVDVLLPLDGEIKIEFRPKKTSTKIQKQIINEIKKVLKKNKAKREEFINTIFNVIERYSNLEVSGDSFNQNIQLFRENAVKIAALFSKDGTIREEMYQIIDSNIHYFITRHKKDKLKNNQPFHQKNFYIKQDVKRNRIKISDDLEALNYGNEKRTFK